jgi:site-specific DNA-methyltransferase (adenine-specific)
MKIVEIELKDIKPYRRNPRKNNISVEPLKRSIEKYGFNVPLVVDKSGEIITGHTRYKAAKELGLECTMCKERRFK